MQRTSYGFALAGRYYASALQGQKRFDNCGARPNDCNACRYQFSVTRDTIFHDSHLPLCQVYNSLMILWENGFTFPCMRRSPLLIWSVWEHQNYIMRPPIAMG